MLTRQVLPYRMSQTSDAQRLRLQLVAADFLERMGSRIRERREALHLSRAELARQMTGRVNENQLYRWEKGKHQPGAATLEELARLLQCDVSYFMSPAAEKAATPNLFAAPLEQSIAELQSELAEIHRKLDALTARLGDPGDGSVIDVITQMLERAAVQQREAQLTRRQRSSREPPASGAGPRRAA